MSSSGVALSQTTILVDTNVIIEAVRAGCWNALTGGARVETVEECRDEAQRGDGTRKGYVPVTPDHLSRLFAIHPVSRLARARLAAQYPDASSMDTGERDLFAHALERAAESVWFLNSPDIASVRAAVVLRLEDRLCSLGGLMKQLGARPRTALRSHHEEAWLSRYRTQFLLDRR